MKQQKNKQKIKDSEQQQIQDIKFLEKFKENYSELLKEKGKQVLLDLDNSIHIDLLQTIQQRKQPFLKKEELQKILDWKLKRGQFRPKLTQLVASNVALDVEEISKASYKLIFQKEINEDVMSKSIDLICQLQGVGPATASKILSVCNNSIPFMSDEVLKELGLELEYTKKHYLLFFEQFQKNLKLINKNLPLNQQWDSNQYEIALYCKNKIENPKKKK